MNAIETIWESSRTNEWSWTLDCLFWTGFGVFFLIAMLPKVRIRRQIATVSILLLTLFTVIYSGNEISEKWRIRQDWAERNPGKMTGESWQAVSSGGANLTMGPFAEGFKSFLLFLVLYLAFEALRAVYAKQNHHESKRIHEVLNE